MKWILALVFNLLFFANLSFAQKFYRISGEYSIKTKVQEKSQLIVGRFFYDKNERKIIHDNTFPEFEKWITFDTNLYKVVNNQVISRQTIPNFTGFSMYHLVLNNQLNNFGLEGSFYKIEKVEKSNGLVISTWVPDAKLKNLYGKILISTKNNNLSGIIFYSPENKILKKQFFEEFAVYSGLAFPGKVVEITYVDDKELYQVTTYKNILVNDVREDFQYYFDVGGFN